MQFLRHDSSLRASSRTRRSHRIDSMTKHHPRTEHLDGRGLSDREIIKGPACSWLLSHPLRPGSDPLSLSLQDDYADMFSEQKE